MSIQCDRRRGFARAASSHRELREHAQAALEGPDRSMIDIGDATSRQQVIDDIRDALWASKVVAYAQGLDEIRTASQEYGWDINVAESRRFGAPGASSERSSLSASGANMPRATW